MPRASKYLLEGYTYHLTHRCENREFLLRFAQDRNAYRLWLREGVRRYHVSVYGYCITSNHVHVVAHVDDEEAVGRLMQLAAGATAHQYNVRKGREGSMWEHPYQCTIVQDGRHLFNCLCYVDLNAVRAGIVSHPRAWRWCGYDEIIGERKRYRILDIPRMLQSLDRNDNRGFVEDYTEAIETRIAERRVKREGHWTESLAVGSRAFVDDVSKKHRNRRQFTTSVVEPESGNTWMVRESRVAYGSILPAGNRS